MKRTLGTHETQEAQKQVAILMALLIAHVARPSSPHIKQRLVQQAEALGEKPLQITSRRIEQLVSKDPLLWLKLLRTIRSGAYDTETLVELGLLERGADFVKVRSTLCDSVMRTSPYPDATWVMNEWSVSDRFPTQTVLYGRMSNLALARTGSRGKRKLSVIEHAGRAKAVHFEQDIM